MIEAAGTRLRPILMTTAATVAGHMPLVFADGPGAGARNSIGIMLVTGMIIGTVFTLFVVPSIYVLVAKTHKAAPAESEKPAPGRGAGGSRQLTSVWLQKGAGPRAGASRPEHAMRTGIRLIRSYNRSSMRMGHQS